MTIHPGWFADLLELTETAIHEKEIRGGIVGYKEIHAAIIVQIPHRRPAVCPRDSK